MNDESIGCLIMVVILGLVVWFWGDIISGVSEEFRDEIESVKEAMTDCEELYEEISDTKRCLNISNCTLTKDELIEYDENAVDWYRYCADDYGDLPL
jgi:hypothetical protein